MRINKKSLGYRRGRAIGRVLGVTFLALLAFKLVGVSFTWVLGNKALVWDFSRLSWWWVFAPVYVPVVLLAATFTTFFILLYSPNND